MNILCICISSSYSADGFSVRIQDNQENKLYERSFYYGSNASYSRANAERAHQLVEDAKKYNWSTRYYEAPYVTDIIADLVNNYDVDTIYVSAGKYVFSGKPISQSSVDEFVSEYIFSDSRLAELYKS